MDHRSTHNPTSTSAGKRAGYVDPATGAVLPTWGEALDALGADPYARPAHVVRFGEQDDIKGLVGGTPDADRSVRYLCKYLTKNMTGDDEPADVSDERARHLDRLAEEARWLPCSEGCANWLRYGVQPQGAKAGMVPGQCHRRAHDPENLGYGGRRVLVSRQWTGKTLTGHKADRAAVVRAALDEAGIDPDDHDELSIVGSDGRWSWHILARSQVDDATYAEAIATAIETRTRWRQEYEATKQRGRTGTASPERRSSAIRQPKGEGPMETMTSETRRLLLRPEEAAKALGVGRTTVFELIKAGELRSVKIGNSRRISSDALDEFVRRLDEP